MATHLIVDEIFFYQPEKKQIHFHLPAPATRCALSFPVLVILIVGDSYSCYFLSVYYEPCTFHVIVLVRGGQI